MSTYKRDFHTLKRELLASGKKFVDEDFPANNRSILEHSVLPGDLPDKKVEWKRPNEIVKLRDPDGQPRFVSGAYSRADLDQGKLGNCWFVAAASVLVTGPRSQFERVVPADQSFLPGEYAGIFRFNFWWYGEWTEVIVDDLLPTNGTRLIYCKNRQEPDEFWCALLEKAYAKLHGSYEALDLGKLATALVDLTGGVSEIIRIFEKYKVPRNFFNDLMKNMQMNSFLTGSIKRRSGGRMRNGLYQGHGYSITGLIKIPYDGKIEKLMRIRNPHGRREWNGAWSDESPEMKRLSSDVKAQYNMEAIDDGEFWMSYDDFIKNFDQVQMCHIEPDLVGRNLAADAGKNNWNMTQYHGEWKKGVSAGGCGNSPYQDLQWINPQYHVQLKDPDVTDNEFRCTVVVSLMEKETEENKRIAIGFDIFKVRNPPDGPMSENEKLTERELIFKGKYGTYQHYREVVKRFSLFPGHYVVIPSTYKPYEEAKFLLRLFTEQSAISEMIYRRGR